MIYRIAIILLIVFSASAQPLRLKLPASPRVDMSNPIPSSRLVDWPALTGIEGGIPDVATYITLSSTVTVAQLNGHISACPSNQQIAFLDGTYDFTGGALVFKNGVSFRGQGSNTFWKLPANTSIGTTFGYNSVAALGTNLLSSGYSLGSTQFVVSDTTFLDRLTNGCTVVLSELNDTNIVHPWGYEGVGDPATPITDGDSPFSTGLTTGIRNRGQLFKVVAVSNNTVTVTPPVSGRGYSAALLPAIHYARPLDAPGVLNNQCFIGFRDLSVSNSGGYGFKLSQTRNVWFSNVTFHSSTANSASLHLEISDRPQIEHCNFYGYNTLSAGILCYYDSGGYLIRNNFFSRCYQAVILKGRGGFGAVLYNYGTATNTTDSLIAPWGGHGASPQFVLWEGNDWDKWHGDSIHGSMTDNVLFRNRGRSKNSTNTVSGFAAIAIDSFQHYFAAVGNELGTLTGVSNATLQAVVPEAGPGSTHYLWRIGYSGYNPTNIGTPIELIRTGNVDFIGGTTNIVWDASYPGRYLPPSIFYQSKPAWLNKWPVFGPDTEMTNKLPAQVRLETLIDP